MTPTPEVRPMSQTSRKFLFASLVVIFVVLLPVIMFYATGYRFDLSGETRNIVGTGGMYVSAQNEGTSIFVDEEPVQDLRVFRRASYIQNLEAGIHRLNVQGEGVQVWTKDVPVYPHIVTEAGAFNMPVIPQVRVVTEYITDGASVIFDVATTSEVLPVTASTSNEFFFATTTATSSFTVNPEYDYVVSLFGTTSATSTSIIDRVTSEVEGAFQFATNRSTTSTSSVIATSTKVVRNVSLFVRGEDVYARWVGEPGDGPYYYCIDHESASTTAARYGEHVYESIVGILASSTKENILQQNDRTRVCRDEIKLDRKRQDILDFAFYPDSIDHVLMVLEDGIYVIEVDDRAWQNTQLLYPGENLRMVVDGGQIYVYDGARYFEVFTERIE